MLHVPWFHELPVQLVYLVLPFVSVPFLHLHGFVFAVVAVGTACFILTLHTRNEGAADGVANVGGIAIPWLYRSCRQLGTPVVVFFVMAPVLASFLCGIQTVCPMDWLPMCALFCSTLAAGHLYAAHELQVYSGSHSRTDEDQPLLTVDAQLKPASARAASGTSVSGVQALTVLLCAVSVIAVRFLFASLLQVMGAPFSTILLSVGLVGLCHAFVQLLAVGDHMPGERSTRMSQCVIRCRGAAVLAAYTGVMLLTWSAYAGARGAGDREPDAPPPSPQPVLALGFVGMLIAASTLARTVSPAVLFSDFYGRIAVLVHFWLLYTVAEFLACDAFAAHQWSLGLAFFLCLATIPVLSGALVAVPRIWANPFLLSGIWSPKLLVIAYVLGLAWVLVGALSLPLLAQPAPSEGCEEDARVWTGVRLSALLPFAMYFLNEVAQALEGVLYTHDPAVLCNERPLQVRRSLGLFRGVVVVLPVVALVALCALAGQAMAAAGAFGGACVAVDRAAWWLLGWLLAVLALLAVSLGKVNTTVAAPDTEVLEMTSTSPRRSTSPHSSWSFSSLPAVRRVVNPGQLNDEGLRAIQCIQEALDPDSERFQCDLRAVRAIPEYGASVLYQILSFNDGALVQLLPFCENSAKYTNALRNLYNSTKEGLEPVGMNLPPYWQMTELEDRELHLGVAADRRTMFKVLEEPANIWLALCNQLADDDFNSIFTGYPSQRVAQKTNEVRATFAQSKREVLQKLISARDLKSQLMKFSSSFGSRSEGTDGSALGSSILLAIPDAVSSPFSSAASSTLSGPAGAGGGGSRSSSRSGRARPTYSDDGDRELHGPYSL